MNGRLDRYVSLAAWGAYAGALSALLLLTVLMDQVLNVFAYIEGGRSRGLGAWDIATALLRYYASLVPVLFVTISPFVSVIAGMFAVSRLMATSELTPMLFTGRPISRVLRPVLMMGLISAALTAACWQFVMPYTSESLRTARTELQGKDVEHAINNIVLKFREGERRQTLFCNRYDLVGLRMEKVLVSDNLEGAERLIVMSANAATWNPEMKTWDLEAGLLRAGDTSTVQGELNLPGLTPDLLRQTASEGRETLELSFSQLRRLQELRPDRKDYVLAFHTHFTYALANIVLLLLALPFAVNFERGSRVGRIVVAVAVCALYLVTDLICQRLGENYLHPVLAAWLPTILFGSIGVSAFSGIRT